MAAGAYQNPKFYGAVPDIEGAIVKFQTSFDESYAKGFYEGGGKDILKGQEYLTKLLYNKFNLKYIKLSGTHSKIKIKSTIEK